MDEIEKNQDEPIDLGRPEDAEVAERVDAEKTKERRGVGFVVVLLMSLLAAGAGAVGGAVLSKGIDIDVPVMDPDVVANKVTGVASDIEHMNAQIEGIKDAQARQPTIDMSAIESRIKAIESRPVVTEAGTVIDPALVARIDALESAGQDNAALEPVQSRLSALEAKVKDKSAETAHGDISDRIDALETSVAAIDVPDLTDLTQRLVALEAAEPVQPVDVTGLEMRLTELEAVDIPKAVDISGLDMRLTSLETRLAAIRSTLPLPAFPRADVLAALTPAAEAKKGWIARTFSKHIKVADESGLLWVTDIETLLNEGQVDAALARAAEMPEKGRAAAQDWIDAVKAQRNIP